MAPGQHLDRALTRQRPGAVKSRSGGPSSSPGGRGRPGRRTRARAGAAPRRTAAARRRPAPAPGRRADRRTSTCTTPSVSSCSMPRRNCLDLPAVLAAHHGEVLGREARDGRELHRDSPAYSVSPGRSARGVDQADHVAREGLLDGLPVLPEHGLARTWWRTAARSRRGSRTMPRSNRPEQTRTNAIRSRCAGSMLACTLNTQAGERRVDRPGLAARRPRRADGGGANAVTASSSRRTPKFGSAAPNEHRAGHAAARKDSMSTDGSRLSSEQRQLS